MPQQLRSTQAFLFFFLLCFGSWELSSSLLLTCLYQLDLFSLASCDFIASFHFN